MELIRISPNAPSCQRNVISTIDHGLLTFIPLSILRMFRQWGNLYFLFICVSQLFPALYMASHAAMFGPWVIVLLLSLGRELYVYVQRKWRDDMINAQEYELLGGARKKCMDLLPGDIVWVEKDTRVPADMAILRTSNADGHVFIRTDQLDGETDWKPRDAIGFTQKESNPDRLYDIILEVEPPHKGIHAFFGTAGYRDCDWRCTIDLENTMWMNTILATDRALGVVIYTGRSNRAMLNTITRSAKFGSFERALNKYVVFLVSTTLVTSAFFSYMGDYGRVVSFFRFMLMFSSLIPISLRTSIEMARLIHMRRIQSCGVTVRNPNIVEDMGRIGFLASDKTGTLTKNEMVMKKIHLGTVCYAENMFGDLISEMRSPSFMGRRIHETIEALAICHNVTPMADGDSDDYLAASPDEVAIIRWTRNVGFRLVERKKHKIVLNVLGARAEYDVLETFPFSSESKRMGIIVRRISNGEVLFLMKGADVVMKRIVKCSDWLDEAVDNMARSGLRTLVIGKRSMTQKDYNEFAARFDAAKLSNNKEMKSAAIGSIEQSLTLLGLTGVEDVLQDGVKISIELLRNAGIKVWMLTGDKIETAMSIARSAMILSKGSNCLTVEKMCVRNAERGAWGAPGAGDGFTCSVVTSHGERQVGASPVSVRTEKNDVHSMADELAAIGSIIRKLEMGNFDSIAIDGDSISVILKYPREAAIFVSKLANLKAVIGSRFSPTQKAVVVELLKGTTGKMVAAIGDGGNDVGMINMSNCGIGIAGKEGAQASLAADFSINSFNQVVPLILYHGRRCYKSSSLLVHMIIHRGTVISVVQMLFSSLFLYAPVAIYSGWLTMGYAVPFTFGPIFMTALNYDITHDTAMKFPELYKEIDSLICFQKFLEWFICSFIQGGVIILCSIKLFHWELFSFITLSFTSLLINEILMALFVVNKIGKTMISIVSLSILSYALFFLVFPHTLVWEGWKLIWKVIIVNSLAIIVVLISRLWRLITPPTYRRIER